MCSDYVRYSNISASTRRRYDSRLRMDRVTLMDAISHLQALLPLPLSGESWVVVLFFVFLP